MSDVFGFPSDIEAGALSVMAAGLRQWAEGAIAALCIDDTDLPPLPLKDIAPILGASGPRQRRSQEIRFRAKLRFTGWTTPPSEVQRILVAAVAPRGLHARLLDRIRPYCGRTIEYLPPTMIDALGKWAWLDSKFSAAVATQLRGNLAHRHLFSVGELPAPRLDPNTYWLLLSLACSMPHRELFGWYSARQRRLLRRRADPLWRRPGWARFWEQWVIALALRGPLKATQSDRITRSYLVSIPLLRSPLFLSDLPASLGLASTPDGASEHPEGASEVRDRDGSLAPSDWHDEAPSWIRSPLSGLRLAISDKR